MKSINADCSSSYPFYKIWIIYNIILKLRFTTNFISNANLIQIWGSQFSLHFFNF